MGGGLEVELVHRSLSRSTLYSCAERLYAALRFEQTHRVKTISKLKKKRKKVRRHIGIDLVRFLLRCEKSEKNQQQQKSVAHYGRGTTVVAQHSIYALNAERLPPPPPPRHAYRVALLCSQGRFANVSRAFERKEEELTQGVVSE